MGLDSPGSSNDILDWSGKLTPPGIAPMDGSLGIGSGVSSVGPGQIGPIRYAQNKAGFTEELFWIKGGHSLRFGGGATRIQTNGLHMFPGGGSWSFSNISNFFQDIPNSFQGRAIMPLARRAAFSPTVLLFLLPQLSTMRAKPTLMYTSRTIGRSDRPSP